MARFLLLIFLFFISLGVIVFARYSVTRITESVDCVNGSLHNNTFAFSSTHNDRVRSINSDLLVLLCDNHLACVYDFFIHHFCIHFVRVNVSRVWNFSCSLLENFHRIKQFIITFLLSLSFARVFTLLLDCRLLKDKWLDI